MQRKTMGRMGSAHMKELFDKNKGVERSVAALHKKKICLVTTVAGTMGPSENFV